MVVIVSYSNTYFTVVVAVKVVVTVTNKTKVKVKVKVKRLRLSSGRSALSGGDMLAILPRTLLPRMAACTHQRLRQG